MAGLYSVALGHPIPDMKNLLLSSWLMLLALSAQSALAADNKAYCTATAARFAACIKPSATNATIRQYDDEHWVGFDIARQSDQQALLVFMTGTGGKPPGPMRFLETAMQAGYRVISLAYNDEPSIAVYCPRRPDPACSENFRLMRIDGKPVLPDASIRNDAEESISARLLSLLNYLDRQYPQQQWKQYLREGDIDWSRLSLAGQSQGAGMAALIAKRTLVARVILFSSPWDFYLKDGRRQLAPWIAMSSVTPVDRWFGGYHAQEATADLLAASYISLKIPADHVRVFSKALSGNATGNNPYHGQGIKNTDYQADWLFFLNEGK